MSVEHGATAGEPKVVGTCSTCGRPLTQVGPKGERLRCLASLWFAEGEEGEKPPSGRRLTPGPLKYDHFEVEVGADGFPLELGAGAMAITYRVREEAAGHSILPARVFWQTSLYGGRNRSQVAVYF